MTNDASKFSHIFIKVSNSFLIVVPILGTACYLWLRFGIPLVFYVNNYRTISYIGVFVLSVGYIFTIFMVLFSQVSIRSLQFSKIRILGAVIFLFTTPLCCLSSALALYIPTVIDTTTIDGKTYYLTGELEFLDSHTNHGLYKCDDASHQCEKTPFWAGGGASFQLLNLMVDKTTNPNEINVTWTSPWDGFTTILEYTYGTQPRYYDVPAQLNDHLYYLAYYRNPEPNSTTFLLYKCELDNTSCKQLPFQYKGSGVFTDTIADEATGEINIFIDDQTNQDTLIFTWGEHPRCYVEECQILENLK